MDLFAAAKLPSTPPTLRAQGLRGIAGLGGAGAWLALTAAVSTAVQSGDLPQLALLGLGGVAVLLGVAAGFVLRSVAVLEERVHVAVVQLGVPPAELSDEQKARFWVIEDSRHPKPVKVDLSGRVFFMLPVVMAGVLMGAWLGAAHWAAAWVGGVLGAVAALQMGIARIERAQSLPMLGAVSRAQIARLERGDS